MSKFIKIDADYKKWIEDVGRRFRTSQIKASIKVNDEMLRFYWSLGEDISKMRASSKYGSGFFENASMDLKDLLPEIHSFSVTNLRYMQHFYEMYVEITNPPQVGEKSVTDSNPPQPGENFFLKENTGE